MADKWSTLAQVRGVQLFGTEAKKRHVSMVAGQPLILSREPNNPVDLSAVVVSDLYGGPIGYVQRPHSTEVARWIDSGFTLLAAVHTPIVKFPRRMYRVIVARIWLEEGPGAEVAAPAVSLDAARTPEPVA